MKIASGIPLSSETQKTHIIRVYYFSKLKRPIGCLKTILFNFFSSFHNLNCFKNNSKR